MTGLKVGPDLVEGTPHVWNGSEFVAPKGCYVWRDGEYVKVWPMMLQQRINKIGQYQVANKWEDVPGWSSDATHPATVAGNAMVVAGGSSGAHITLSWSHYNWGGRPMQVRLLQNGAVVYTSALQSASGTTTYVEEFALDVAEGDSLQVQAQYTSSFGTVYIAASGTFLEVGPG